MRKLKKEDMIEYVKRTIWDIGQIEKIGLVSFDYDAFDKCIYYNVLATQILDDDEMEELRIAQTEILSDFPEDIEVFKIRIYKEISGQGKAFNGITVYSRLDRKKKISNVLLIQEETSKMEGR